MTVPTINVDICLTKGPLEVPGPADWTSLSSRVRQVTWRRGRNHELQRSQAGTGTIRLNNNDRALDPTNEASIYWPNLLPMRQVRVYATHLGIDYPCIYGFIEDYGQVWAPRPIREGGDAEIVLSIVDAFKVLSLFQVSGTGVHEEEILAQVPAPTDYWKFEDAAGIATAVDSSDGGNNPLTVNGAQVTFDVDPSPLIGTFGVADFGGVGNTPLVRTSALHWTQTFEHGIGLEFWINVDAFPSAGNTAGLFSLNDGTTTPGHGYLLLHDDGHMTFQWTNFSGSTVTATSPVLLTVGEWTHIMVRRNLRNVSWWKNAVHQFEETFTSDDTFSVMAGSKTITVGAAAGESAPYFDGKLAHFVTYQSPGNTPTTADLQRHYAARLQVGVNDEAGSQINGLLDLIGWPDALRDIDTTETELTALDLSGSVLETILSIGEDTEQGIVQVTADGKVLFHSRRNILEHSTVMATFSDETRIDAVPYSALVPRFDDQDLYSRVIAQRNGGSAQEVENPDAREDFGPRALPKSGLRFADDADVLSFAQFTLAKYDTPAFRVASVTFPGAVDEKWPWLLSRDAHHDKVAVVRTPPGGGSPITENAHIEGISGDVVPGDRFTLSFALVPAFEEDFWIWDVSNVFDQDAFAW